MKEDVVLINIIGDAISKMTVPGITSFNYQPGYVSQIMKSLSDLDNSISYKATKYPLIAVQLPIREKRGLSVGFYAKVVIPRIVIATISKNATDDIFKRFEAGGNYESVLYPCYYEFLNQLAASIHINGQDPYSFEHTKVDNPGNQPLVSEETTDYVDTIEILNLELKLLQIKTC